MVEVAIVAAWLQQRIAEILVIAVELQSCNGCSNPKGLK